LDTTYDPWVVSSDDPPYNLEPEIPNWEGVLELAVAHCVGNTLRRTFSRITYQLDTLLIGYK